MRGVSEGFSASYFNLHGRYYKPACEPRFFQRNTNWNYMDMAYLTSTPSCPRGWFEFWNSGSLTLVGGANSARRHCFLIPTPEQVFNMSWRRGAELTYLERHILGKIKLYRSTTQFNF